MRTIGSVMGSRNPSDCVPVELSSNSVAPGPTVTPLVSSSPLVEFVIVLNWRVPAETVVAPV